MTQNSFYVSVFMRPSRKCSHGERAHPLGLMRREHQFWKFCIKGLRGRLLARGYACFPITSGWIVAAKREELDRDALQPRLLRDHLLNARVPDDSSDA